MKIKSIVSVLFLLTGVVYGHAQNLIVVDGSLKVNAGTEGHSPNWPKTDSDGNRNPEQALIVVKYDGFPEDQIGNISITPDLSNLNGRENLQDAKGQPITFLYVPIENNYLNIASPYGPAKVNLNNPANKGIYEMTLMVDKKMNIDIEPLSDYESITVYLDRSEGKSTPARFNNVSLGRHSLLFELPDGSHETREINVTVNSDRFNSSTNPDFDLRKLMPVTIESDNRAVTIYVDDVEKAKQAPATVYLPAGDHTFKVVSNSNEREFDISTIKMEMGISPGIIRLQPRERKKFEVTASFEGKSLVPVMLYVDKEEAYKISQSHAKGERPRYVFDLPVGNKYKFKATYQGNEGSKTITVTPGMDYDQTINIKKRRSFVWPWEREYSSPPVDITAAYVQKQYRVKHNGQTEYKGTLTLWDVEEEGNNKWLHGLRAGVQYQPVFAYGLGLYTGLFYEYYRSTTDIFDLNPEEGLTTNFSKYQEHSLNLPVEVLYNLPFSPKVALAVHGGLEAGFTVARSYSGRVEMYEGIKYEDSYNALKDEDGYFPELPGVFSLYWQAGVQLRLGPVMLGAQFTRPITKHNWEYEGYEFTTTAIKNSFSLTYVF